ncbi:MAG: Xylulokinase [Bacteroidota bacterium]|jgi:xylulokinase
MFLCGIDLGTSSIKVSIVDASNQKLVHSVSFPEEENEIISLKPGFAEQSPDHWWYCVKEGIKKANASKKYDPKLIKSIGISYQMHGLVIVDKEDQIIRNSIIWCDSRATPYGNQAYKNLGEDFCNKHYLNSPGNFTAAKLAWVKDQEYPNFEKIKYVLLPGDFISFQFTGNYTTTASALSEGILWDFKDKKIATDLIKEFGFTENIFPKIQPVFSNHGQLKKAIADELGLSESTIIGYKAGDQPNNALSLGVLNPGEIATTAGTSGVVYGVSDELKFDPQSRVNSFAHVNYSSDLSRIGVLMCINGTGILNRWLRQNFFSHFSYNQMNELGSQANIGSKGLICYPFGNGSERIFQNKNVGGKFSNLDFNLHTGAEIIRAAHEGIAFSMVYGIELMANAGIHPTLMKAGKANMYLSNLFTSAIVNSSGIPVELLETDGALGAALGSGVGAAIYISAEEATSNLKKLEQFIPDKTSQELYKVAYENWKESLIE